MSMLAEQKRRTKWVINPVKKPLWTTDSSGIKFGKQLMEKMGWSAGKGLGLNEQGIQEPLKVGFKNDTKGMGFKENLDDWIEHQDEFNILLNQLRSSNDSSVANGSNDKKIMSLEEKSKQSKARVHYPKFTRGKDLSKYTANDLACILGTNKTKKEKPKTEDVIKTESKENGNCETSFGVTTINSGSIQDYFKKKWITDTIKSSNFLGPDDNTLMDCSEGFCDKRNSFSVHDEDGIKLVSEKKKSRKRKHKSSSDFDSSNVEDTKLSVLHKAKNIKRVEKKKKQKKEVVHSEEECNSAIKNESGGMDEDISEKRCYVLEKHESLSRETENSSKVVRQRMEDKNHMKLCVPNFEEVSKKEIKEKRRKTNVEECTTEDVFPTEKMHDVNNRHITLEGGSIKRKKKKKNRKEKLDENEMFENQYDNCNQDDSLYNNTNRDMSEIEPVKNKKRRRRAKSEKLDEINVKYFYSLECGLPSNHINDSCLNVEKTEKLRGTFESEDTTDVKSQKKKKSVKEKTEEPVDKDSYNNQKGQSSGKLDLGIVGKTKISCENDREDIPEMASRKKKKKNKNEKVEEIEEVEYEAHQSSQVKNSHLDKEFSGKNIFHCQVEDTLEVESFKIKKKKKRNKEKSVELETKVEEPCLKEEKGRVTFEEESAVNVEFAEKKEKNEGIESKSEQSKQSKVTEKNSVGMRKETEKSGNEVIGNKLDLIKNNNGNNNTDNCNGIEGNDLLNTSNTKPENRIEKLRANLFHDKAADKYFPEQGFNERVLKLIRWADISEFRGCNLRNIEGYGRQNEYEKQFR